MDDDSRFKPEFPTQAGPDEYSFSSDQYAGAFFPKAKHFLVAGGKFKSVTHVHQAAPSAPPDFPVIPLGHVNLLHEIGLHRGADVVHRKNGGNAARKMYTARVHGCKSDMTVALYQGNGAEDKWRKYISQYSDLRHAYLAQLYGIVSKANLHAAVFHDDLIHHTELVEKYRDSHLTTVFLWSSITREFADVNQYISSISARNLHWTEYRVWIRSSTGHLCIDLTPPETGDVVLALMSPGPLPSGASLFTPPSESGTITSLSLRDYHKICDWYLGHLHRWLASPNVSVKLGSIRYASGPEYENSLEVASSNCGVYDPGWATRNPIVESYWPPINCNQEGTTTMANGWIRICSAAVVNEYYRRIHTEASTWLAQANYIFNCLEIPRGFENFVSIHAIDYDLKLFGPTDKLPSGYLFLCPLANLQPEDRTCFRIPDCAAYWSLDPSGFNRLSWEVAEDLGFPAIHVEMYARVQSWDASVYNRIRQFQKAKGFDPYSQEVARALGCPPLRVSCDWKTLLTHIHKNHSADCSSDSDGLSYTKEGSESGDGEYDSTSSELRDGFPVQDQDIDPVFPDALEDQHDFIPTANGYPSLISEQFNCQVFTNPTLLKKRNCLPHPAV